MSRRIVVLSAGVSAPSSTRLLADQLAAAVETQVSARGESADLTVIELRELAVDLATLTTTGITPAPLGRVRDVVSAADGLVAVTPVFGGSYSGLCKMFVDALDPDALNEMPVLVAATAGTPRHALMLDHAMRPLFTYLRAVVVPTGVFAATEDFGSAGLDSRIARAAAELGALVVAEPGGVGGFGPDLAARRPRASGNDVGAVIPFAELLRGHQG